ncbi:MAG: tetratricopeptide repeat protein, partial [Schleiferiaceae bacterium]|nr:tetratricopeptide repeat protein [Schleiferiaceae bacterium]
MLCSSLAFGQVDKQLGIEYFKNQQYEKALSKFNTLYKQSPTDEYYRFILDCYLELKQLDEAEKFVNKHIRKNGRRATAFYVDLGYIQQQNNNQKGAEESFNSAFEYIDQNPGIAYSVSQNFARYGFYNEALEAFERAEQINPNLTFDYQKALIYADMGDIENMYKSYLNMIEKNASYYNSVLNMLRQSVKTDPQDEGNVMLKELIVEKIQQTNNPMFNDLLVWLLIQERSFNAAFIQLKALDKRQKRNQSEIFNLGKTATYSKDYATAEKCYNYIIKIGELSPFYQDALFSKAFVHKEQLFNDSQASDELYANLLAEFEMLLTELTFPGEIIEVHTAMAEVYAYKLRQPKTAEQTLTSTLEKYPAKSDEQGLAKILLGDITLAYGDPWEALLLYAQVDKAFGDNEIGQEARFKKAMVAFYQGDFDWAKTQFDVLKTATSKHISNDAMIMALVISDNTFLDTDSNFTALKIYAHAKLLVERQDLDSALILLAYIESTYPAHSLSDDVLWERAQIELKQGKTEKAIETLTELSGFLGADLLIDRALFE